jgi:hypothetical protein
LLRTCDQANPVKPLYRRFHLSTLKDYRQINIRNRLSVPAKQFYNDASLYRNIRLRLRLAHENFLDF